VSERKLLEKYKGLKFWDNDQKCYQTITGDNLEWRTKKKIIHYGIALLIMKGREFTLGYLRQSLYLYFYA
jgi:hypothetical protein